MKILYTLLVSLANALSQGSVLLPNLMFVGLYYGHYGVTDFIMPFVLLYAMQKSGVFFISSFGRLKNPYKLWLFGMILAIVGCAFMYIGSAGEFNIAWDMGAVFIGLGLSGFPAFYKTCESALKESGYGKLWNGKWSMILGYAFWGVFVCVIRVQRYINMYTVITMILFLLVASLVLCLFVRKKQPYRGEVFEKGTFHVPSFGMAVLVLILVFTVRFLKQTADIRIIFLLAISFMALIIVSEKIKKQPYRLHSIRTLWYGAAKNFVNIFSLLYYLGIGASEEKIIMVYVMIILGDAFAMILGPILKKRISKSNYELVCIMCAAGFAFVMLLPGDIWYLIGVLLIMTFASMGSNVSMKEYMQDERFVPEEKRLVRSKFNGIGAVFEQVFMLLALVLCSYLISGQGSLALSAYAKRTGFDGSMNIFFYAKLICISLNFIFAIYVAKKNTWNRKRKD